MCTLSKHKQSIEPDTLMTRELIQEICFFLSLLTAKILPTVVAAGSATGMAIVRRSSDLIMISFKSLSADAYKYHRKLLYRLKKNLLGLSSFVN